jgi:hypothetical protein
VNPASICYIASSAKAVSTHSIPCSRLDKEYAINCGICMYRKQHLLPSMQQKRHLLGWGGMDKVGRSFNTPSVACEQRAATYHLWLFFPKQHKVRCAVYYRKDMFTATSILYGILGKDYVVACVVEEVPGCIQGNPAKPWEAGKQYMN